MTPRDRNALIGGAAVVGLAVLLLRVLPWGWRAVADASAGLQDRAERLAYMRAQVADAKSMEDSGTAVRKRMTTLASVLLSGSSAGEAVASLGSRVGVAAERARVGIRRTDVLDDSAAAGIARRVSLRASVDGDTRGVLGLLGALASAPELTSVDAIQIAAEPAVDPARPEVLHGEITVSGWYLPRTETR
jgi:hypothetical protein